MPYYLTYLTDDIAWTRCYMDLGTSVVAQWIKPLPANLACHTGTIWVLAVLVTGSLLMAWEKP